MSKGVQKKAPQCARISLQHGNQATRRHPQMKQQFALILNTELAISTGFSLDELVFESKKLFDEEGIPGF